jgi:hypothetical protein
LSGVAGLKLRKIYTWVSRSLGGLRVIYCVIVKCVTGLAVLRHAEEVTGNVAMTCRYFGISRQLYYTWLRRYRDEGP